MNAWLLIPIITASLAVGALATYLTCFYLGVFRSNWAEVTRKLIPVTSPQQNADVKQYRVLVTGIMRNVEEHLAALIDTMDELRTHVGHMRYFFYENDSEDGTAEVLRRWKERLGAEVFDYESEVRNDNETYRQQPEVRFERMARYRNQCQQWIKERANEFTHVIVMDCDLVGGFNVSSIMNLLARADEWDMVAANGLSHVQTRSPMYRYYYYDSLAFADAEGRRVRGKYKEGPYASRPYLDPTKSTEWLPVKSAFGGMAIYRANLLENYTYNDGGEIDCEHVMLHRQFPQGTRMFIDPEFIIVR